MTLRLATSVRCFSARPDVLADSILSQGNASCAFRAPFSKPNDFTLANVGQWYSVERPLLEKVVWPSGKLLQPILSASYRKQADTFCETAFMIRRPFLDVVNCMKHHYPLKPVNRCVLYGKIGTGKSTTVAQALLHAYDEGWIICHAQNPRSWNRRFKEISMSTWKPGRIDLPLEAANWLKMFLHINAERLERFDIRTSKAYKWTQREVTGAGEPLSHVVDYGINRVKFASDCMGVVLRELKLHANQRKARVFVSVDYVNSMFNGRTRIRKEDLTYAKPNEISLNHAFQKMLLSDWINGFVLLTVDIMESDWVHSRRLRGPHEDRKEMHSIEHLKHPPSPLPLAVLGKEGFEHLDPFIPIQVDRYSEKEAYSAMDYYTNRNWLQHPDSQTEDGRQQILHLSVRNPLQLERLCASL